TAAGLKGYQLATEPLLGTGFLDSRWLLTMTVEFELLFGLWLLANIWPKLSWAAAMGCFSLFTCISLYKALSGYTTCGCFGRLPVNPWWTATLDLVVVFSLLRWRPKGQDWLFFVHFNEFGLRTVAVSSVWLVLGLTAAFAIGKYTPATLSSAGEVIGNGEVVVLEPERWIGKRFPLLPYIDIGRELGRGEWLLLLYHHDCPDCQATIRTFGRRVQESARGEAPSRIALIEIPPYGKVQGASTLKRTFRFGKLPGSRQWVVETPATAVIHDGIVREVCVGHENVLLGRELVGDRERTSVLRMAVRADGGNSQPCIALSEE
ncbi:MAG: MauE/DoxX family redox-associated membrane protein, partial [Thermoguttaceae bacterium]